jgi:hypothetical protein
MAALFQALPGQLQHFRIEQSIKIPKAMLLVETCRFRYSSQAGLHI